MKTYTGHRGADGALHVYVQQDGTWRELCRLYQHDAYSRLLAMAGLARTLLDDAFGSAFIEADPDRLLRFTCEVVGQLDRDTWTLSLAEIQAWGVLYEVGGRATTETGG